MSDAVDLDSLTAAATEAANHNDPAAAEALLRLALDLQIAASGPEHPDLAATLNNLALMLERQGNTSEAERCYRRAYDIARRSAPADDEIVTVSRDNLIAFLRSIGVRDPLIDERAPDTSAPAPLQQPPARRTESPGMPAKAVPRPAEATPPPTAALGPQPKRPAPARPAREAAMSTPPAASARGDRSLMWIVVPAAVAGIVAAWFVLARPQTTQAPLEGANSQPTGSVEAPPSATGDRGTPPAATDKAPPTAVVDPAPASPARDASSSASTSRTSASAVSADGRLCISLTRGGEWRCDAAGDLVNSDAVYYYTRVRTPRDAVVRHRWTYQGEVVRTVDLQVRANAEPGYRTFSRQIVTARDPGPWEVALLSPDGEVIDSQRFTTR
jgi:hypothetical protein